MKERLHSPLQTDLYELTMAQAYWKAKMNRDEGVFTLFYRKAPFEGTHVVAAGLKLITDYLDQWRFEQEELDYLASLSAQGGGRLFEGDFLSYLKEVRWTGSLDAIREGEFLFPFQPALRVTAPIILGQLLETVILNLFNFSSLVATKAARLRHAAGEDPIIEFGLRRAQGLDGGLTASRAAYIGGCDSTSNTLAGMRYGIPVQGTQAHSWVMAFEDELESFKTFGEALPNQIVFLVDTYDSLLGIQHAIEAAKEIKTKRHAFLGVRLDSGDLCYLSKQARKLLDNAGFEKAKILASNELDEYLIQDLKSQGACIDLWGVGTKLVTGEGASSLGGVYKLSAYRKGNEKKWRPTFKFSEQFFKASHPGILQVRRFTDPKTGLYCCDSLYEESMPPSGEWVSVDPLEPRNRKQFKGEGKDLLVPIYREGKLVYTHPSLDEMRRYTHEQGQLFDSSIRRFVNPHSYPSGMESGYFNRKSELLDLKRQEIQKEKQRVFGTYPY
jgi:nicotinate phosphoribosyltransferase